MKKSLQLLFVAVLLIAGKANAQSTLLHYWDFNHYTRSDTFPNILPIIADYSIIQNGMDTATLIYKAQDGLNPTSDNYIHHTYIGTYTASNTTGEDANLKMGDSVGNAIRVANPSDSMEMRFYIPTTGYKNIIMNYVTEPSSLTSGQLVQLFDYSLDSGATFISTGLTKAADTATVTIWRLVTVGITDIMANNNNKMVFRIRFSGNNSGTSGNNRFDNISVTGDSIAPVDTATVVATVVTEKNISLFPNPATDYINIGIAHSELKRIDIYNVNGVNINSELYNGNTATINIAAIPAGVYYTRILLQDGTIETRRFIKQ